MPGGRKGGNHDYEPNEDESEEKLFRQDADEIVRRYKADMAIINNFLDSLKPEDAYLNLLSWAYIDKWKLRRKKDR